MNKITFLLLTMVAMSTHLIAGGVDEPVEAPVAEIPGIENTMAGHRGMYVGVGISAVITYEDDSSFFESKSGQDRTGDITLIGGYDFNQYVAVEGRYMTSFTHDQRFKRNLWGIYVKPQYPIMEKLNVYGLLGYGSFQLDGRNGSGIDADENGFQWGIGASYAVTEHFSVFTDYLKIASDADVNRFISSPANISSDAITVGVTYKF